MIATLGIAYLYFLRRKYETGEDSGALKAMIFERKVGGLGLASRGFSTLFLQSPVTSLKL